MKVGRRVLRALFFAAEAGTLGGIIIFELVPKISSHPRNDAFDALAMFTAVSLSTLLVVSLFLRLSDGDLANIGFVTCFLYLWVGAFFPRL